MTDATDGAPLQGRRLLLTRPDDATGIRELLRQTGAEVVHVPATRIVPVVAGIADARLAVARADSVAVTSRRAVELLFDAERMARYPSLQFACVGTATAAAVTALGGHVCVVAEPPDQDGLVASMLAVGSVAGLRVLFPAAVGARGALERGLLAAGATVERIDCYESLPDPAVVPALRAVEAQGAIDLVVLTAPSTVHAWVAAVGADAAQRMPAASIGARTSAAIRAHGIAVAVEAATSSAVGLRDALIAWGLHSPPPPPAE
jgi:uroporphyrinogen III methyltransferase/synthase